LKIALFPILTFGYSQDRTTVLLIPVAKWLDGTADTLALACAKSGRRLVRRVIVSNVATLDGFFETLDKKLDWVVTDAEFFDYAKAMLRAADTLLFGRATYEHMASYWPTAPVDEIADQMNSLPKLVFSRKLHKVEWNNSRLAEGNPPEEVSKLKKQAGKDIVVLGSATVASSLLQAGMVDEYRVILQPVLIGKGNSLFKDITERVQLKLISARSFGSGVVLLSYQKP
jgi:dihydrofolate reductase